MNGQGHSMLAQSKYIAAVMLVNVCIQSFFSIFIFQSAFDRLSCIIAHWILDGKIFSEFHWLSVQFFDLYNFSCFIAHCA